MEHLNKTQIILLAVLVSFVSSIATGIVTVTLMQQTPANKVTETINRVVEKTIEKIIPVKGPTVTETKIVKEEDLVVLAIEKNSKGLVKITSSESADISGNGIILTEDGFIATDINVASIPDIVYQAEGSDGKFFRLNRILNKSGVTIFKVVPKDKEVIKLGSVSLADSEKVKVGQTMISLGDTASIGIVSGLSYSKPDSNATTTPKTISSINTSTNQKDSVGSAVMNLDGDVIGMVVVRGGVRVTVPSNIINDVFLEAQKIK
ncbi:MAG: trypsin-like peptidase domain-containing protein [Patescibacteria group bacterium]